MKIAPIYLYQFFMIEQELSGLAEGNNQEQKHKHNPYGKLKLLADSPIHLSLGPNYRQFCLGFCTLLVVVICVLWLVNNRLEDGLQKTITNILGITATISYMFTALGNPGLYDPAENVQTKTRYCHRCMHFKPKNVVHCYSCDTCIEGFDHHCPWISKCVGKGNILCFYSLMASLTLFSIYVWYTIYLVIMNKLN